MMSRIQIGSGLKIKRLATIKDNAEVKRTLNTVKQSIKKGLLDEIFEIITYDIMDNGKLRDRNKTISEIDADIIKTRNSKINDLEFAEYQMDLFSKYLKKNIHSEKHGYSLKMILNFIDYMELHEFVKMVLDTYESEKPNFITGQYNNHHGMPETIIDRVSVMIHNEHHNKQLE